MPLDALRDLHAERPGRVLSVYLSIDARAGEDRDRGSLAPFQAALKNRLAELDDPGEARALSRLRSWIKQQLASGLMPGDVRRGMALFATDRPRTLHVLNLARPISPSLTWADDPDLAPLEAFAGRYPALGIIVVDRDSLTLIGTLFGDVVDDARYEIDRDTSDWRRMEGPAPGFLRASRSSQVDRHSKRLAALDRRWWQSLEREVAEMSTRLAWTSFAVVAPPEQEFDAHQLAIQLGVPLVTEIRRNLAQASPAQLADLVVDELAAADLGDHRAAES